MKKRSQSSYVDLNAIKASLELKIKELEDQKNASDETINSLKEQLENKKFDFMKVEEEIEAIKNQKDQEINAVREEAEKKIEEVKAEAAATAEQPAYDPNAEVQYDPYGNPIDLNAQPAMDPYGNPYVQSETIMADPYGTEGGYLVQPEAYGQLTPYEANYGYPTGMYDGTQFYPVQRKSDKGIWVGVGIAAAVLLIILILDILVLLSLTNVAQIF
ncbi:hypothetical protein [Mycoplasmopsis fermentans]|nr:hypothetical protein [Mycoplasmopsis fermentans]RMX34703.1 hypothetical protein MFI1_0775 [Mycoplasmopsis fermentans MF-I1]